MEVLTSRLGYLLKHAQLRLGALVEAATEPHGLGGRELAVLAVLAEGRPLSQLEAAERLGVDRTTMVALLDALEAKGVVERRRSPEDRRRNIVELTPGGRDRFHSAETARAAAEREFLAALTPAESTELLRLLRLTL
ncbi:MarR family winged helix-turn-helix transcriptional regulator [Actinocorallia longicatena]|uniref:HTH marR-type domain-containing protein n=1 Tax=Actinocorallia longicatena TaxID=111803 RepID=A0ABP6Q1L3_9ACTN